MTRPQEQLDALVANVTQCADVGKNAVAGLIAVGEASMHCHIAMPITTESEWETK